jgi:hypothetical protein
MGVARWDPAVAAGAWEGRSAQDGDARGCSRDRSMALAGCIGPGTHPVTQQVQNGTIGVGLWRSLGGDACYWARLRAFSGQPGDVIADDLSHDGPRYVQVLPTDAGFEQSGCLPFWQEPGAFARPLATPGQPFGPGDFKVGYEVTPGVYRSPGADPARPKSVCYWARLSGFTGGLGDVIENKVSTGGEETVTITAGDTGFTSDNCGVWTRIG